MPSIRVAPTALETVVKHRWFLGLLLFGVASHAPIYGDGLNFDACVVMAVSEAIV